MQSHQSIDLGTNGHDRSIANAINNNGIYGSANGINDLNEITGVEGILSPIPLIESEVVYQDLMAEDINNAGQIVGTALIDGDIHAVLLNPSSSPGDSKPPSVSRTGIQD